MPRFLNFPFLGNSPSRFTHNPLSPKGMRAFPIQAIRPQKHPGISVSIPLIAPKISPFHFPLRRAQTVKILNSIEFLRGSSWASGLRGEGIFRRS
jgi:hypothetical protein